MPAPERTTPDAIVAAGRAIVEDRGLDALTMSAVAERVGVRAPSLYKRVGDRDALVRGIAESTVDDLGARMHAAVEQVETGAGDCPRDVLITLGHELRAFAHEYPNGFRLIFGPLSAAARPDLAALWRATRPMLDAATELAGEVHALEAARTLTAWANGFLIMELADAFRLGGDLDDAYKWGLTSIVDAMSR